MSNIRMAVLLTASASVLLAGAAPALAGHGGGVHVSIYGGFGWGYPWYPYWGGVYAYPVAAYPYPAQPPAFAVVDTDISPEKARVILDGEDIGKADNFDGFPDYLYVTPGEHTIEFRAEGYRPLQVRLNARGGLYYGLDRSLARLEKGQPVPETEVEVAPPLPEGAAAPFAPAPAPGEEGSAPQSGPADRGGEPPPPAAAAPPGAPVDGPGAETSAPPPGRAGGTTALASVTFRLRPADAAVWIDGKLVGGGDAIGEAGVVRIAGGRHRVEVVRPGYLPFQITVHLRAGESRTLTIELDPDPDER